MAPVILGLKQESWAKVTVLVTAQHREMLDRVFSTFSITSDIDLNIMEKDQDLSTLTSKLIFKLHEIINKDAFDMVLAQGDTTTIFTAALASFYAGVPFGHVEAGLRTHDHVNPFLGNPSLLCMIRQNVWKVLKLALLSLLGQYLKLFSKKFKNYVRNQTSIKKCLRNYLFTAMVLRHTKSFKF
jgi:hypothetical protein